MVEGAHADIPFAHLFCSQAFSNTPRSATGVPGSTRSRRALIRLSKTRLLHVKPPFLMKKFNF
jgi:hypothetical protein